MATPFLHWRWLSCQPDTCHTRVTHTVMAHLLSRNQNANIVLVVVLLSCEQPERLAFGTAPSTLPSASGGLATGSGGEGENVGKRGPPALYSMNGQMGGGPHRQLASWSWHLKADPCPVCWLRACALKSPHVGVSPTLPPAHRINAGALLTCRASVSPPVKVGTTLISPLGVDCAHSGAPHVAWAQEESSAQHLSVSHMSGTRTVLANQGWQRLVMGQADENGDATQVELYLSRPLAARRSCAPGIQPAPCLWSGAKGVVPGSTNLFCSCCQSQPLPGLTRQPVTCSVVSGAEEPFLKLTHRR